MLHVRYCLISRWLAAGALMVLAGAAFGANSLAPLYAQLHWREVGPFRGGWSTMAAGIPGEPNVFYFGAADGGVWKSADAGLTWQPLFQQAGSISIGALAIAPSNPDVLYVGTGQVAARYDVVGGDGLYRSTDGGKTWAHIGLKDTQHIGRIWIDPKNPDIVLVAALGDYFGPNQQRGIFRSTDGGQHWHKVLYVNSDTGAVDLSADDAHPKVIFAATWQARMYPWLSYFKPQAGPGSGIWKSTDEGNTWIKLSGHGLPAEPMGRIGLAVAPGSNDQRVYAIIDSQQQGKNGLYRSDDGGAHWKLMSARGLGNSYFGRVTVDPKNPDIVYVMNRSVARSTDGGKDFSWFKGAPGGDDYHFMWINPDNDQYMILASDQGTTVSVDGGQHWSSWYNQPTGQFYHVAADNRFPYRLYSGQQDSGTVETKTRGAYGDITSRDWHPVGGDERSYAVPDTGDPDIVYVGGLGGHVSRFDTRTADVQNISAWPISHYGERPTKVKYRYNWFYPVVTDPRAAHTLYLGSQYLFKTSDGGLHWRIISPDLSGADPKAAGNCDSDAITLLEARACGYGEIFAIAPSSVKRGEIWVGSDDGVIHLTRDGGKHWQNVTPAGLPLWGRVNQIDASPTDPASAYAAVDAHRRNDRGAYIYRTHDYGHHWTQITSGISAGQYVYVVRQDLKNPRLLYAGTNAGVYVSFDDGDRWQPLQLNLPTVRVRDLTLHGDDLIAATQGRALWILDDITPLRQARASVMETTAYLFKPAAAVRVRNNNNKDTPLPPEIPAGRNPPAGAILDYWLGKDVHGSVKLAIYDGQGKLVRAYASDAALPKLKANQYFTDGWLVPPASLPATPGAHRFIWDLRFPRPRAIIYGYSIAALYGQGTPMVPRGPRVLPGRYTVELTVNGVHYRQPLTVTLDPRVQPAPGALAQQLNLAHRIDAAMDQSFAAHASLERLHTQLAALKSRFMGQPANAKLLQTVSDLDQQVMVLADKPKNDDSFGSINRGLADLATQVDDGDRAPPASYYAAFKFYMGNADTAMSGWKRLQTRGIPSLNTQLTSQGLAPLKL
ncbi:MAG: WD40/YVTN/BNR-like repeat-containing protein [Gammaproteobacteria bacterium]